jgi:hypothetical protein
MTVPSAAVAAVRPGVCSTASAACDDADVAAACTLTWRTAPAGLEGLDAYCTHCEGASPPPLSLVFHIGPW